MSALVPARAERLLRWSLPPFERSAILGDLEEEFATLTSSKGEAAARQWYWQQVVRSIPSNLWRRLQADPRRKARFYDGLRAFALGVACEVPRLVTFATSGGTFPFGFWSFYALYGASQVGVAVFYKRIQAPRRQRRMEKWWTVAIVATWVFLGFSGGFSGWGFWAQWVLLALLGLPALLPRLPADPSEELRVEPRAGSDLGPPVWSLEMPSESLGLSGLVLRREWDTTSPYASRLPQVTIERVFAADAKVRVRAAVRLSGRGERASVELIDRQGKQVWQTAASLIPDKLVEVPANLDELADRDPEDRFGLIDEPLPLAMLPAGPYRLRVTVTNDIFQSSFSDEQLSIR